MKTLIAFALLISAAAAHGQLTTSDGRLNTFCGPTPRVPPLALPAPRLPPGLPKQLKGTVCTEALVTADMKGAAVGWWCPRITPENAQIAGPYAVKWDAITLPMLVDFGMLLMPGVDTGAKLLEMQTKYQTLNILDMCDVWHPLVDRLNAIYPPPLPLPQQGWKANGTTIFKYASGRLTVPTSRKATLGAACDGVTVVTAGAYTYQGLVGGPLDEKTACTRP